MIHLVSKHPKYQQVPTMTTETQIHYLLFPIHPPKLPYHRVIFLIISDTLSIRIDPLQKIYIYVRREHRIYIQPKWRNKENQQPEFNVYNEDSVPHIIHAIEVYFLKKHYTTTMIIKFGTTESEATVNLVSKQCQIFALIKILESSATIITTND